jgi:ferredoxin
MKVNIDKNKCTGCGSCAAICPKIFALKDGKAIAKTPITNEECAKQAADFCPVKAISIS